MKTKMADVSKRWNKKFPKISQKSSIKFLFGCEYNRII